MTVPASKSTSDQRNPAISPRRNPDNARYVNESVDNEVAHVGVDQFSGIVQIPEVGGPDFSVLDNTLERLRIRVVVDDADAINLPGLRRFA